MPDSVDRILAQWATVRPNLDVSAMGILGRLSRLTRLLERAQSDVFDAHGLHAGEFDILATLLREIDPENRRTVRVALTAAGAEVIEGALVAHVENEERLLSSMAPSDRKQLANLLSGLLSAHESSDGQTN